ncbi:MAG: DUF429 domain-containing protein [Chitinispirillaceae bacterium]
METAMAGGVDGCRGGWFSVFLSSSGEWKAALYPDLISLWLDWENSVSQILIDIPIGFRDSGGEERSCDTLARKKLGKQKGSSVFRVPCRRAVYCSDYGSANSENRRFTGKGLSKQAFNIISKMREADQLLRLVSRARNLFRESHPEVCFAALAGKAPVYAKNSPAGFGERLSILKSVLPDAQTVVEYSMNRFRRKDVARDDILDALVLAVSALNGPAKLSSLPKRPEYDSSGLRMEIVLPD